MSRLTDISASPTIREYAQGLAQDSVSPVADFLAPTVPVSTSTGRYKIYTAKNRFHVPDTKRALGGNAAQLAFNAEDATYNCTPRALDFPVDMLEQAEADQLVNLMKEGAQMVAQAAALDHEKQVIDAALAAVGAGTAKTWNSSADPVADLDDAILSIIGAAAGTNVGVLFGATAFKIFKNAAAVRGRFIVGGKGLIVPSEAAAGQLLLANPEVRTSYMVRDTAAEGKAASYSFLLDSAILIFARKANPTRMDPSFMKTFRLMGKYMTPGTYSRDDGRVEVAKFDWSEDIKVTNSTACIRLNIS
jgi:hypothetical protein